MSPDFKKELMVVSFRELATKPYFNVCRAKEMLKLAGKENEVSADDYSLMSLMHCVEWRKMPPNIRNTLFKTLAEYLDISAEVIIDVAAKEAAPPQETKLVSILKRIGFT